MPRSWLATAGVLATGALLGSFLGKLAAVVFPQGRVHDLFSTEIAAGLHPTQLDLHIVDLTFGCLFHLNVLSIVGIVLAAWLYRKALD